MKIVSNTTHTINLDVMDGNNPIVMMNAGIRPEQGLNISVDVFDTAYVAEHKVDVAEAFGEFLHCVLMRANADGLPVLPREMGGGAEESAPKE